MAGTKANANNWHKYKIRRQIKSNVSGKTRIQVITVRAPDKTTARKWASKTSPGGTTTSKALQVGKVS